MNNESININTNEEVISELDLFLQLTTKKMDNELGTIYKLNLVKEDDKTYIRATVFDENNVKVTKMVNKTETKKILSSLLKIDSDFEIVSVADYKNNAVIRTNKFDDIILADIEDNDYLKDILTSFAGFHIRNENIEFKKYMIEYKLV